MAESLVVGAAVGAVFGELLKAVLDMKDKAIMFKQTLVSLRSTLLTIAPVIKEIEQYNNDLGRPKEELESLIREMEEGTKLVLKCSKIYRLNYLARVKYQEQLLALSNSLERFFTIDIQAQNARDLKETLLKVRRIYSAVNKKGGSSDSSSPVPVDSIETEESIESETESTIDAEQLQVTEDITRISQKREAKVENSVEADKSMSQDGLDTNEKRISGLKKIKPILHKISGNHFHRQARKDPASEGCPKNLDLEDLLSATTAVLLYTSYTTTYKAILKDGRTTLLMKKLKDVVVTKDEFERLMEIVQRVSQHPNVVPLRASYYTEDEKLLIYDYIPATSLSKLLKGTGESRRIPLDWVSRVKISLEVAKGIAHIHSASGGKLIHGNISSSNVLVTSDLQIFISDLGLAYVVSGSAALSGREGYQAPQDWVMETEIGKSDVYSFGVLLLEMLTGKSPGKFDHVTPQDMSFRQRPMMELAESCVGNNRPSMSEVVRKLEGINQNTVR